MMAGAFPNAVRLMVFAAASLGCAVAFGADPAPNEPRIDYLLHCGGCHGMAGDGAPPVVPPLDREVVMLAGLPAGRDYLVQVPGSAQSRLDDAALARVLNWMLESFGARALPEDFTPFTAGEVGRVRAITLTDPLRRRAEIWSTLPSQPEI